jgi:hypothetical protein
MAEEIMAEVTGVSEKTCALKLTENPHKDNMELYLQDDV